MKKNTKNLLLAAGAVFVAKEMGLFGDDDKASGLGAIINGKKYTAHLYSYSKSDANEVANKLKKMGWITSVRKRKFKSFDGTTSDMYAVFKRK